MADLIPWSPHPLAPSPTRGEGERCATVELRQGLDYLVIGHVTRDIRPGGGFGFGGTVSFSSLAARQLGRRVGVLTRAADDLPALQRYLQGIALHVVPAPETTTFENVYGPHGRTQYVRAVAPPIPADAVPPGWELTPIVHLGPIAQEVPVELVDAFPSATLIGATPQGWLRSWDDTGLVRHPPWRDAERALDRIDVLIFSAEDVGGDRALLRRYAELARLAVVTDHHNGCIVWEGTRQTRYPAFDVPEVDPTGAGDVFATAFLLRYAETGDPAAGARFANCAASFVVEGHGTSVLPTQQQIEGRLRTGKTRPLA